MTVSTGTWQIELKFEYVISYIILHVIYKFQMLQANTCLLLQTSMLITVLCALQSFYMLQSLDVSEWLDNVRRQSKCILQANNRLCIIFIPRMLSSTVVWMCLASSSIIITNLLPCHTINGNLRVAFNYQVKDHKACCFVSQTIHILLEHHQLSTSIITRLFSTLNWKRNNVEVTLPLEWKFFHF